jgi:filamentous hemagglutinin
LNYKAARREIFPKVYPTPVTKLTEDCDNSLKVNWEIDEQIRRKFKLIHEYCTLEGHINPQIIHDRGFLAFVEGDAFEAIECSKEYHVPGHNDFRLDRSVWEHPDPEGLLRRFAGTGVSHRGKLGQPGYKEAVDFKEHIGIWVNKDETIRLPTTRGEIHYGKKGAHIVPTNPTPMKGQR